MGYSWGGLWRGLLCTLQEAQGVTYRSVCAHGCTMPHLFSIQGGRRGVGVGGAHELEFPGSEATTSRVCLVPRLLIKNLLAAGDQGFRIKDSKQGEVTPALGPHAAPARGLRHAAKLVSLLTHSCRPCFPEFEVFSGTWDMLYQPQDCWRAGMLLCSM